MDVHAADRAASPAAQPPEPRVGAHGGERQLKRKQEKEQRFTTGAVDVVLVTGNELEEVRHGDNLAPYQPGNREATGRQS